MKYLMKVMSVVVVDLLVAGTNQRPQTAEMISVGLLLLLSWESSLRYALFEVYTL